MKSDVYRIREKNLSPELLKKNKTTAFNIINNYLNQLLNTDNFDGNFDNTITDIQKLADFLDDVIFGDVNVQPDWSQSDTGADDYIKNKPTIPSLPSGSNNQLLRHNGSTWAATSNLLSSVNDTALLVQEYGSYAYTVLKVLNVNTDSYAQIYIDGKKKARIIFKKNNGRSWTIETDSSDHNLTITSDYGLLQTIIESTGEIRAANLTANTMLGTNASKGIVSKTASDIKTYIGAADSFERVNNLSSTQPFNTGVATYYFDWSTAAYSNEWDTNITRATNTDRLTNTNTNDIHIKDNCCIEIQAGSLDKTTATMCYAELYFERYDSSNSLIEQVLLDKTWVPSMKSVGTLGDFWGVDNMFLQGNIEYILGEDEYSKMRVDVTYDGSTANCSFANGMQEHHEFKLIG